MAQAQITVLPQSNEIIVPSYSAWFKIDTINDIEKSALPEFFNNKNKSKTPLIYKDYRDFMINTYRLNPVEYLTVDPDSKPSAVGPGFTGHFRLTADTPKGLTPFEPSIPLKSEPISSVSTSATPSATLPAPSLSLGKSIFETGKKRTAESEVDKETLKKVKYACSSCDVDCSKDRYHNVKKPGIDICPVCYTDGRFPATCFSSDFVKLSGNESADWTNQELLLLLEGLELYNEDWSKVADHVKTRTREECILQFLKLPIEDTYVGPKEDLGLCSLIAGPLKYHRQLFSASENPVLSLAAFLGSAVDPKVAAAAAKAAIDQLPQEGKQNGIFPPGSTMEKSAATALGAAAAKSKALSLLQEKECSKLVNSLVQAQMNLIDLKLKHFETLEAMLDQERRDLQAERTKLYCERIAWRKRVALAETRIGSSLNVVETGGVENGKMAEYPGVGENLQTI